jgi:chorismate dehydratase
MEPKPRIGRIRYINVLPIYHAIDQAWVGNSFQMVTGTPAELNSQFYQGLLDISAISSYEYGRHYRDYLLLPQLAIATRGDVGSVLFFSRLPCHRLSGKEVLLSAGSGTSAALVKVILTELYGARPLYRVGPVTDRFIDGCYGMLAIGDEALRLKARGCYPYFLDLGRAWYELTGLPFVFGVWAARRDYCQTHPEIVSTVHRTLLQAKVLGLKSLPEICRQAATVVPLAQEDLAAYFQRLNYDLDAGQQEGLTAFFKYLYKYGEFQELPRLQFI